MIISNPNGLLFDGAKFTTAGDLQLTTNKINVDSNYNITNEVNPDEVIKKVMKGTGSIKQNKIAQVARGLNSLPGMISTFIISPVLLGVLIPKLTYSNTRKAQEKILNESKKNALDNEKNEIKA